MSNFASRLKELRKKKEMTQEKLAKILGVKRANIAKWETINAVPNIDILTKLADYFDVDIDYLLGYVSGNGLTTFSDRLKALRKEANLTQQELADKVGTNRVNITKWETGRTEPSLDNVVKLANILNISTDYLLGRRSLYKLMMSPKY